MTAQRAAELDRAVACRDYPKLVMLAVLHMAQYYPAAFTGVALPFIFRQEGLPLEMFWLLALPGTCLFLMVLAINLFGDGLRDVTLERER